MLPDEYLAQNVAKETHVKIIAWKGHCEVHERFTAADIELYRQQNPGVIVLAHPECPPDVVAVSDFAGSTAHMIDWVESHKPKRVVLVTECSMSDNVAANNPDVEFIRPCQLCPHMKRITLKNIRHALETMTTEVFVHDDIASRARVAVERMIAVR
jgi:quinolinate synthase